ncbi:type II secretory pathway pseudopilin PulG/outer membrane murein-binding lipoprotein Lpp [Novosphingobium chloroacetimidivorans]|uniref:Type II secretory pathway pseudopilin PulG/outer membrane murein-binding lipoprotein Lpp n=1 Tax=Novosphingobium chloroacetimidivorans TaxID=1428314 RepID=A0A7W7K7G3_9SPHN|nr:hypothetical protein [Novosphingobium chloroacetimidivorans]MBB4857013.1 type II secretory pathway pseudopilin PulG/outer membrane murein-binding lipoprotein Lpp [Novosphingobium chloroacetimidivorans]
MPQPFDYLGLMGGVPNVPAAVQNAVLGEQQRQQNANLLDQQAFQLEQAQKQAALAEQRRQAMGQDFGTLMAQPNAASVGRFMMTYPEAAEGLKKGWDTLSGAQRDAGVKTSADVHGYLTAGNPQGAIDILQRHMDASKQTGEDVSAYPQIIEMIRQDPQHALAWSAINLASAMGAEKFADNYGKLGEERRAEEVQPYKVQQEAAEASIKGTEAQYKPATIQSDLETQAASRERWAAQTANEVATLALNRDKLELDRDTLASNIQIKMEELDRSGTQLDAGGRQAVNAAVGESVSASALADRMNDLADRMKATNMSSGWVASFREGAKGAFGSQDPVSGLRGEYATLVNAQAVKNLPPGPASDKDIQLAKQGFPPSNASPEYLQSFLRGMAKMQQAVAAGADRRANWLSVNGSLAPARRDIDVGGVMVPAGTTYAEFNGNAVKRSKQGQVPAGLQGILKKYGAR